MLDKIQDNENRLEFLKQQYLIINGWKRDCQNPACMWVWCKEINGKTYCLDRETAFMFQRME